MRIVRYEGNEIIRTPDQNSGEEFNATNIDLYSRVHGVTQVITGLNAEEQTVPNMSVKIKSGSVYDSSLNQFLFLEDDVSVNILAADPVQLRKDTIEIRRNLVDYDVENRQFKDAGTGTITDSPIATKTQYTIEVQVLTGSPGGNAPAKTSGWIKIAEIYVPASATSITNSDIKNADARSNGELNTSWTNDVTSIYKQGSWTDISNRLADIEDDISDIFDGSQAVYNSLRLGGVTASNYARTDITETFNGFVTFLSGVTVTGITAINNSSGVNTNLFIREGGVNRGVLYHDQGSDEIRLWGYNDTPVLAGGLSIDRLTGNAEFTDALTVESTLETKTQLIVSPAGTLGESVLYANYLKTGLNRTADGSAFIDLIGDTFYTDYGLRLQRSSGENGNSSLTHRGTGTLVLYSAEGGDIQLDSNGGDVILPATVSLFDINTDVDISGDLNFSTGSYITGELTRIGMEGDKHWITVNDGGGNFNIRVANSAEASPVFTEAGYASHWVFDQTSGTWNFKVSSASGAVDDPVTWTPVMAMAASLFVNFYGSIGVDGSANIGDDLSIGDNDLSTGGRIDVLGNSSLIRVGAGRTVDGNAILDLVSYIGNNTSYDLRIVSYSGINAGSEIIHKGTGTLYLHTTEGGDISFYPAAGGDVIVHANTTLFDVNCNSEFSGTMIVTGLITANSGISVTGSTVINNSAGLNTNLFIREGGVNRGVLYHDQGSDEIRLRGYNDTPALTGGLSIDRLTGNAEFTDDLNVLGDMIAGGLSISGNSSVTNVTIPLTDGTTQLLTNNTIFQYILFNANLDGTGTVAMRLECKDIGTSDWYLVEGKSVTVSGSPLNITQVLYGGTLINRDNNYRYRLQYVTGGLTGTLTLREARI